MKCTGLLVVAYITILSPGYSTPLAEQCGLDRFMDLSLVKLRGSKIGLGGQGTRIDNEIRIINSIQFTCPTQIDSIILGIDIREQRNNRNAYPGLQLWRPTNDGGDDDIELVPDSERIIVYTPANVSSTGIHEYPLVPPLNATPGDYLAISQPKSKDSIVRVYTVVGGSESSYRINIGITSAELTEAMNELVLIYPTTVHSTCVISSVKKSFVRNHSLLISKTREVNDQRQFLYPDMKFMCNGTIHKWIYSGISDPSKTELPELQVWRQTSDGNYNKRGSSKVSASGINISLNVYELIVDPPIEFMEGDIFGLYQPRVGDSAFRIYEQVRSGPSNLRVMGTFDNALDAINNINALEIAWNDYPLVTLEISALHSTSTASSNLLNNTTSITEDDAMVGVPESIVVPVVVGIVVIVIIITVIIIIGIWGILLKDSSNKDKEQQVQQTSNEDRTTNSEGYGHINPHLYMPALVVRVMAMDNVYEDSSNINGVGSNNTNSTVEY